ncbi:MAG TPA: hypothetical protein VH371_06750 [Candidatus Limnocylindrales bacterium]|jgi:hypothetical protein
MKNWLFAPQPTAASTVTGANADPTVAENNATDATARYATKARRR